ncbi:Putative integral membrane protein [Campylobacter insulaenigrae]|uniref:RDD family protein n=1 Tax=Campylobacter insulaenigrae TaxID=260714 RepID=UPI000F6DD540|nr:RDD family protein [Campylobacter insulaenigrae]MCR6591496.1 RDD family protein [Campylobacter insulaenigrae]MCR6593031.1 RDD family protein [Campylobacter insulaenigrae]VEJ52294.1 Putative integral membrane protein [Campylobacter insulaenigrae]
MKTKAKLASRFLRFKAFLIDIFLLYVPILYLFYFILGSKEAFLNNQFIVFFCSFVFGLIQAIFLAKKAQSPGFKAYDLYLINIKTGKKLNFFQIIFRYIIFIVGFGLLIGFIVSFLRKDTLALHDVLSQSIIVVRIKNE